MRKFRIFHRKSGSEKAALTKPEEGDNTQPAQEWMPPQEEEESHTQPAGEWTVPLSENEGSVQPENRGIYPVEESSSKFEEEDDRTVSAEEWKIPEEERSVGSVECRSGIYAGAVIPLDQELVIGRDETCCNLIVKGSKISRKHCSIRYDIQNGVYVVTDFSSNGIFDQNGTKFPQNIPVFCSAGTIFSIAQSGNEFLLK